MQVVDATREHAEDFLTRPIRQADLDEWFLGTGRRYIEDSLMEVWDNKQLLTRARALLYEDRCIALWGSHVHPDVSQNGTVWLIASQEAERRGRSIHRLWRGEIAGMHRFSGTTLRALAHASNHLHLHWLEVVGFKEVQRLNVSVGIPFILFERHKDDATCATQ